MQIDPIQLKNQSQLLADYRKNNRDIMDFFDYLPYGDYGERVNELDDRSFDRERLTDLLHTINKEWGASASTLRNIDRLKEDNSVVVIGGQQAGLMTGPMYTINKVISIIQFARQQEEKLGIPVVPVFWIAGEDHDFDEINHIYLPETPQMRKYKLPHKMVDKRSVSDIPISRDALSEWVENLFGQLHETMYTKELYESVNKDIEASRTYTDFFARMITRLFSEDGIVLIDSGDKKLRQLESNYFQLIIKNQPGISEGVYASLQKLNEKGYTVSLEAGKDDGHLFYHRNGERILLVREAAGDWVGKQNEIRLTTDELMAEAEKRPELFSNNVVTRPLMQELLFPTLAFIGGPGEVGYWAALKPAFRAMDLKMPPVVPRLSFTIMERTVAKALEKYEIEPVAAINEGVQEQKEKWIQSKSNPQINELTEEIKMVIEKAHQPLRDLAKNIQSDLGAMSDKNLSYLYKDIDFLKKRLIKALEEKYAKELYEFDLIDNALHPHGGLQERVWNPFYWMNENGMDFIKKLSSQSCSFENGHYVIYL
ncbi:bacillithiol biosynthesis cysteine-adding enzyme BshC [Oceanobacillus massiliensis]|uniref:bacillithiol biosynthesis cysteine-adding enzyme BshC n=1 Tax=Oceanobacillus massiliensis TaxID=1465765 RepID=UPI003018335A